MGPICLHVIFDLPQIQVRFPGFAEDASDAGRTSLGHLDENAFVLVRDHVSALAYFNIVNRLWRLRKMGRPGLEPGTNALKGRCSTD